MPRISEELAIANRLALIDALAIYTLPTPNTIVNPEVKALPANGDCKVEVIDTDTISAALMHRSQKVAILNFASFKNPGGGFLNCSIAQEEFLCYCSNLYDELCEYKESWYEPHKRCLHNGMYENQSLLSKDISIVASAPGKILRNDKCMQVDVLTCAAPNWTSALKYGSLPSNTLFSTTEERIDYVMQIFSAGDYDTVVLGAFGCGVFRNDPLFVAKAFKECLSKYTFKHVIFAVPDCTSYNYKVFAKVFS